MSVWSRLIGRLTLLMLVFVIATFYYFCTVLTWSSAPGLPGDVVADTQCAGDEVQTVFCVNYCVDVVKYIMEGHCL